MLLQIDGWFGGGKGVLWLLLDGHPDVYCSPIHDYSYCTFLSHRNDEEWVQTKHIELLRKTLARTQFHKLEKVFLDKMQEFSFSTGEMIDLPVPYDYYEFNKLFGETVNRAEMWTLEYLIDTLYESLRLSSDSRSRRKPKWYASSSYAVIADQYERIPKILPNAKSIQVRRPVEAVIATRSNRKPMARDCKTKNFFSAPFHKRIEEGEVEKILELYRIHDELEAKYPDVFMKVDFNELVNYPEKVMPGVADFLGIEFSESMLIASYNGKEIVHNGKKYIGQELDKVEDLLTEDEIKIIGKRIEGFYKNKKD